MSADTNKVIKILESQSVKDDEIVLRLINPLRPGLISGKQDDFWYLIMPIRLAS